MQIQEAAQRSGLTADTIRFYERTGVLPRPPRGPNGYRAYTEDHLATLRVARGLRDLDLPLTEVAGILPAVHDGTCRTVRTSLTGALTHALQQVDQQIASLQQTRERLAHIFDGLQRMEPSDERIPGAAPCACIQLIEFETQS